MVGAIITEDDKLIISLTFDGDEQAENKYFIKLKIILESDISTVLNVNPANYNNEVDLILVRI